MKASILQIIAAIFCLCLSNVGIAASSSPDVELDHAKTPYQINAGDVLFVHVWKEETFSLPEVLVRPDGRISLPIIGEVSAGGKSIEDLRADIVERLKKLLKDDPVVTVSLLALRGNTIYVLGYVARPGQFMISGSTDVTQALALAGGTTTFADKNDIRVLRRDVNGVQTAIKFNYGQAEKGKDLDENILLKSGDVVIVP